MRWALLLVAAGLLAGCGANDPTASEDVSAAAERTASVGSSRISIVGDEGEERMTGEGAIDYDRRRGQITIEYEPAEGNPLPGEMLFVGDMLYMPTSIFGMAIDEVDAKKLKPWMSADLAGEKPTLDTLLFPFPFIDPTRLLNAFEEVSGDVESLGPKEVRGVDTEGYRLSIDLRRVIEEAPAAHREALLEELESETRKTQPVEIWIDEDGFARRLFLADEEEEVTVDFYDFGVEVDVEAPPADQVESADDFFGGRNPDRRR